MSPERFAKLQRSLNRRQPDLSILMEGLHKPHNYTAVLRNCDAVGVWRAHAVASEHVTTRLQRRAQRSRRQGRLQASSGSAAKWVDVEIHPTVQIAIRTLQHQGFHVMAAHCSPQAVPYRCFDFTQPTVILLGTELYGVSPEAAREADSHIEIPMLGLVESLNVSVAAAVLLYEAQRQRADAGMYDRCRLSPAEYERTLFEWAYPGVAARCRDRAVPYPQLNAMGEIISDPQTR